MSPLLLQFAAWVIVPAISASARPAATFLVMLLTVGYLSGADLVTLPPMLSWLLTHQVIILALIFTFLELVAHNDSDLSALLAGLYLDRVGAALSSGSVVLVLLSLGLTENALAVSTPDLEVLSGATAAEILAFTFALGDEPFVAGTALVTALLLSQVVTALRARVVEALQNVGLYGIYSFLESGGVLAALILLPFAPLLALLFFVLAILLTSTLAVLLRGREKRVDQKARQPCRNCDELIRIEASRCRSCGAEFRPAILDA